jgi:hypothetical protein
MNFLQKIWKEKNEREIMKENIEGTNKKNDVLFFL